MEGRNRPRCLELTGMGTITFTVVEGGQPNATKTFTVPDTDIDRFVAAWQQDANVAINGTATRPQVLLTWANYVMNEAKAKVLAKETAAAQSAVITPPPISAT
jgi:hypothetical protein